MYGMAGYAHMGAPVDMVRGGHGLGLPFYDTEGSTADKSSGNSILDWIDMGINVVGTIINTVKPGTYTPPVLLPAPQPVRQAGVFGVSTNTLLMVGAAVVVGTLLFNRKR